MGDNLLWLFGAFAMGWIIHMVYLFSIATRQKKALMQLRNFERLELLQDTAGTNVSTAGPHARQRE